VYIYISLKSNINIKFIVFAAFFFALILISGNLLVGKIDAKVEDGFWSVFEQSVKSFFDYLLQGPILFSEYMENENLFNPTWDALIFNCQVLAKVNLCELPLLHQEFSYISYNGGVGNVYSVFYSIYPKYGWLGLVSIMGLYGIWAGYHHRRRYESIFNLLMAGFLFSAIILSVFSDTFGPSIYFFLKIFLIGLVVSLVLKKTKNSRVNTGC
ncbi:MAG: oligosaccharide repeat unit polymerase, partial [Xylophilus sp.]|nr:oligosaccharide repeat unit polymerase [Xylophilus sp.]